MINISFLLLVFAAGVESLVCPMRQQPCGSTGCYDPTIQGCSTGNTTIQCINSCNGTCYSNSQYCYNNTTVCNNGESVCDVKTNSYFSSFPLGATCYNSSQYICGNNTLCYTQYSCGTQCLLDYNSVCANNRTVCSGFYFWNYYYSNRYLNTCGPQQTCYDNTTSVCLNRTTVCQGLNARLCGTNCFNTDTQICTNGTVQCINSCNGTCYSNSQYCYNNTTVCNNGESVCDVKTNSYFSSFPLGATCYNSSQYICGNNTLCYTQYSCGTQCLLDYNSVCANNRTVCSGFYFWNYYYSNRYLDTCGPQQTCYDNTTSICLDSNGTVCPVGSQLCSGLCYNPQSQYCTGGNNTIYCINNPSSWNCPTTSTNVLTTTTTATMRATLTATTTVTTTATMRVTLTATTTATMRATTTATITATMASNSCCRIQNCTTNSDCCQPGSVECQCYRHNQTDVYGSCMNPYVTPICGNSCPIQGVCRYDSDCCKCQCAQITFTGSNGQLIIKKQCAQR